MELFDVHTVQVEGWLKGELLYFLDLEKQKKLIDNYFTESSCGVGRKRVDLLLVLNQKNIWVELKHFQIGKQKDQIWNAYSYFSDKNIGIYSDVDKLNSILDKDKFILVLATKNPGVGDWSKGVNKFNEKNRPLKIISHTKPSDFPASYYVGLLEIAIEY
jgi:hypothetical protein